MTKDEFDSYAKSYIFNKQQELEDEGEHEEALGLPLKIGAFVLLGGIALGLSYAATTVILTIVRLS